MDSSIVHHYFPNLDQKQRDQINKLGAAYSDWNQKINVVSRKDVELLYERHVLHSLGIAKYKSFERGTKVLDVGTGGGFPGLPLAILFPDVQFTLVDSIRKKIKVVDDVIQTLGLENIVTVVNRAEAIEDSFDYVVARAVMKAEPLIRLIRKQMLPGSTVFMLKGGDLREELKDIKKSRIIPLGKYYQEEFFTTKSLVVVQVP